MNNLTRKTKIFLQSVVTYAAVFSLVVTSILQEIQSNGVLPDNWVGPVVAYGGSLLAIVASVVAVIKRVTPVPEEGLVVEKPSTMERSYLTRGWF